MKFDRNKAFPYPVLRPYCDDYVDVEFQTTVDFLIDENQISVEITYALSSEEILKEIDAGKAKYVSIVSCRDTYQRKVLVSDKSFITDHFDLGSLRGEVRVDPYIVVTNQIDDFSSEDINPEFGDNKFSFTPGDLLAQDETQVFFIDRDLFKPVTSVVELVKDESLSGGEWKIGFDEENLQIQLSPQMKEAVDNARNSKQNQIILLNSLYFSAVVQAIQKLKDDLSDFEEKKWAKVVIGQLNNNGWDIKSHEAYQLAQRLMRYPLSLFETYIFDGK